MLRPPDNTKALELILAMGSFGSGKTNAWMSWAYWMKKTGAESRIQVINTDRPTAKLFDTWDGLEEVVTVYPDIYSTVENYEHLQEIMQKVKDNVVPRRNDLVVVDLIGSIWDMCQDSYSEKVHGKDLTELLMNSRAEYLQYLEQAKANREKNIKGEEPAIGGDYGKEWGPINRMYRTFTSDLLRTGAHVFACTGTQPARKDALAEFKRIGLSPRGQKDLGHFFDTTLWFQTMAPGDWRMTTVRETSGPARKRVYLEGERVSEVEQGGFVGGYLVKVAGWKL